MNRQELLKQAHYTLQRGNRELAQKLLAELLTKYPKDEAAWMLLARAVKEKERKIECYEHVLKLNQNNPEAKLELARVQSPGHTYDSKRGITAENSGQHSNRYKTVVRSAFTFMAILLVLGSTTFVIAKNNPQAAVAKLLLSSTPRPSAISDIASQARTQVQDKYPQYASLVDTLINFALDGAENGMEGAPERPGEQIYPSENLGNEARSIMENAASELDSSASATLTEQQITSWFAMGMKDSPVLPVHDIQVYLRDGKIQVWGIVQGQNNSTAALAVSAIEVNADGNPSVKIETVQIGLKNVPTVLLSQVQSWLNQMLVEEINKQAPGLHITQLAIGNGVITISGTR